MARSRLTAFPRSLLRTPPFELDSRNVSYFLCWFKLTVIRAAGWLQNSDAYCLYVPWLPSGAWVLVYGLFLFWTQVNWNSYLLAIHFAGYFGKRNTGWVSLIQNAWFLLVVPFLFSDFRVFTSTLQVECPYSENPKSQILPNWKLSGLLIPFGFWIFRLEMPSLCEWNLPPSSPSPKPRLLHCALGTSLGGHLRSRTVLQAASLPASRSARIDRLLFFASVRSHRHEFSICNLFPKDLLLIVRLCQKGLFCTWAAGGGPLNKGQPGVLCKQHTCACICMKGLSSQAATCMRNFFYRSMPFS